MSACSAPTNLYSVGSFTSLHHDAVMRIGSEAPRRRPQSTSRHEGHVLTRDTATSNRHRRPSQVCGQGPKPLDVLLSELLSLCGTEGDALGNYAIAHELPQGDEKLAR